MTDRASRGFQLANLDVGLLDDPKFLKLGPGALVLDPFMGSGSTLIA